MYKVLLVDDEDIEREGMAAIIPWEPLGLELTDMAWNGIEGLEKIQETEPDLVITDIKMPVMNGIQLIRKTKELYPSIRFVVLSGYGEYEYTSQAMELGIRHYILKPCDEVRISEVLRNVVAELDGCRKQEKAEQEYRSTYRLMLPHVKERVLNNLLTQTEIAKTDEALLKRFLEGVTGDFLLLSIRSNCRFEQLDSFVLTNILEELLGEEKIYMSAARKNDMVYLLPGSSAGFLQSILKKVHQEYQKYKKTRLCSAISRPGGIHEIDQLYGQLQELFYLNSQQVKDEILTVFPSSEADGSFWTLLDYQNIRAAEDYGTLLFEIYTAWVKMKLRGCSFPRIRKIFIFSIETLFEEEVEPELPDSSEWDLLEQVTELCASRLQLLFSDGREDQRMRQLLYAIYKNIKNPELSIQYLAKEVLFMNEDYLGRLFSRYTHEKYSSYLLNIRISLAQRLMACHPELLVAELAEETGYPADGQYFSKVFRKKTGMSPSEYRQKLERG